MISSTSRDAYADHRASGRTGQQQAQVLQALEQGGEMTRHQIAEATGLYLHSVCGRCNELLAAGLVHETDREHSSGRPRWKLALSSDAGAPRQEALL